MAYDQKKTNQTRPKTNWLLSCFGCRKPPSDEKGQKSGGRKRWFRLRLCLPRLKVMSIRKRKGRLVTKVAALKATQTIMFDASKVQQLKLQNDASNTHHQPKEIFKESIHLDNRDRPDQSNDDTCHRQDRESKSKPKDGPSPKGKGCLFGSNVSRDSLIGLSIMVVTLIIMSIWGRLYAILCMSAWFYCVPLLRPTRNFNFASNEGKSNLDSTLHNKKVVSKGLLQGDHNVAEVGVS